MAVDEMLLARAERTGQAVFRLYGWSQATLSLGYFQRWEDRFCHQASLACPMVRRPSGGGAIVHDQELTYCLALPYWLMPDGGPSALYGLIHQSLVELFATCGLVTRLWECSCPSPPSQEEPFLCFQRRNRWDVVAEGPEGEVKLVGSAQRRTRSALLQHGSILLARSPAAPELPGLQELLGRSVRPEDFSQWWLARVSERLGWRWKSDSLTPQELAEVTLLLQTKYANDTWNLRR